MRKLLQKKKGAIELSISTIVVVVLAMSMLILGIVLVRNIMCGSINLVTTTEGKVKGEIEKLFQSNQGEVVCIGQEATAVVLVPGEINTISCAVQAPKQAEYQIKVKSYGGSISESVVSKWVIDTDSWKGQVAPGDVNAKKFLRLSVPNNAPDGRITMEVEVYKDGTLMYSPTLDFDIRRLGFFRAAVC